MLDALQDLGALDRDVRRAAERVEAARAALADEAGRDEANRRDPFEGVRHVAALSTYKALSEGERSAHELPHRDALLRWIHELLQARVGRELEVADAEAAHAVDPTLTKRGLADPAVLRTYAEAMDAVLRAPGAPGAALALDRAATLALPVAAVRRERRERRVEAARRMGLAGPWALAAPGVDVPGLAARVLDATEPLASARFAEERRRAEGPWHAAYAVHAGLARDAVHGWPARLGERWLGEIFGALAPREVTGVRVPEPLGGASFLRAAAAWGSALRLRGVARSLPFALARDPYPVGAYRFGGATAIALAEPLLQRKALGVSARAADAQARALRGTLLLHLRTLAARVLLAEGDAADRFEELTARVFGASLPAGLRGAWPGPRADDPARLLGAIEAFGFTRALVARFDEDWWRNPRAGAHLAALAAGPVFEPLRPEEGAVEAIARAFEEAIG